jgi:hypothetical protein
MGIIVTVLSFARGRGNKPSCVFLAAESVTDLL